MSKTKMYYLHVKDVMRDYTIALDYDTIKELAVAYNKYVNDSDYEVISMHSTCIETEVITSKDLCSIRLN